MSYSVCRLCGKMFEMNGGRYCSEKCYTKDAEEYQKVRKYVLAHQGVSAMEASNATGISMKSIMRYVDEGWIGTVDEGGKLSFEHFVDQYHITRKQDEETHNQNMKDTSQYYNRNTVRKLSINNSRKSNK